MSLLLTSTIPAKVNVDQRPEVYCDFIIYLICRRPYEDLVEDPKSTVIYYIPSLSKTLRGSKLVKTVVLYIHVFCSVSGIRRGPGTPIQASAAAAMAELQLHWSRDLCGAINSLKKKCILHKYHTFNIARFTCKIYMCTRNDNNNYEWH